MDDATFNQMMQQFADSGAASHDPLRDWTAGLNDALNALPVVVTPQAASAPVPSTAAPHTLAVGSHAAIQQYATVSAATTSYDNSSAAPPQMLQQTMTTPVPPPFGYYWAGQVPLNMSYAVQATTAAYAMTDAAWPYSGPAFGALPQMAHSATFHDTATVVQPPPPPPPPLPPPLAVTHDYAAPTDVDQSTYPAEASYVGPVIGADAQSSAGSLPAPSHTQQTSAQRNSATPSAPQDRPAHTKFRPIAPKPAPPSVATPSTSTAPSPVPHGPGTPLFPAQAPRLVLAPYSGILRGPPPSELLDEAPMAASLPMLVPPALSRNRSAASSGAPPAKQPRHPTKKPRKLASASKQRGQPAPAAVSRPVSTPVSSTPPEATAEPPLPRQATRSWAKEPARAAATTTTLDEHEAPAAETMSDGPAALTQGPMPALVSAGAPPMQAGGEGQQRMPRPPHMAESASQRKRARPEAANNNEPSAKRSATSNKWHSRSTLDASASSLPVGPRVHSDNNHKSQQRSHALQVPPPSQETVAAHSAAPTDSVRSDDPNGYGRPLPAVPRATSRGPAPRGPYLQPGGGVHRADGAEEGGPSEPAPMPALEATPSAFVVPAVRGTNVVQPPTQKTDAASLPGPSSAPSSSGGLRASATPAGFSSGTGASGSRPFTSAGVAQGSGAAAGPSQPQAVTDDEEDGVDRKEGGKKKKKRTVNQSTNALGSLQAGLKWYSWMAPS